jgi:hypothetical protein
MTLIEVVTEASGALRFPARADGEHVDMLAIVFARGGDAVKPPPGS